MDDTNPECEANTMQFDLVYQIVAVIGVLVGSGLAIFKMYYWYQDRKPEFTYEKMQEMYNWKITILHPDKPIHRISITLDGKPLPLSNIPTRYERSMRVGEGQNFDVGKVVNDQSIVIIKADKRKIKKKWKDIPTSHVSM